MSIFCGDSCLFRVLDCRELQVCACILNVRVERPRWNHKQKDQLTSRSQTGKRWYLTPEVLISPSVDPRVFASSRWSSFQVFQKKNAENGEWITNGETSELKLFPYATVDGRNPAPPGRYKTL